MPDSNFRIPVTVGKAAHARIAELAKADGRSMSSYCRKIITDFIEIDSVAERILRRDRPSAGQDAAKLSYGRLYGDGENCRIEVDGEEVANASI